MGKSGYDADFLVRRGGGAAGAFGGAAGACGGDHHGGNAGHYGRDRLLCDAVERDQRLGVSDAGADNSLSRRAQRQLGQSGGDFVTYDFGSYRIVDGVGQDFNVYEFNGGGAEFDAIDVLVSVNGVDFFNVGASALTAVDLAGDELHGSAIHRQSYDLAAAVAALGSSQFRYLRLDGTASGSLGGPNGFDLDGVGLINFGEASVAAVPEPATWAFMIAGFGAIGGAMRRSRRVPIPA